MKRRGFLKLLLGAAAVGATVGRLPIPDPVPVVESAYSAAPRGFAHLINSGQTFWGVSTSVFPDLNALPIRLHADPPNTLEFRHARPGEIAELNRSIGLPR